MTSTERIDETAKEIAQRLYDSGMKCNCDLDNWQPENSTGHSWVCRIHKKALEEFLRRMESKRDK